MLGTKKISAQRAIFGTLVCDNADIEVVKFKKLDVQECSIDKFTNIPLLPFTATRGEHIVNKGFVENLINHVFLTTIEVSANGYVRQKKTPTTISNDIFVLVNTAAVAPAQNYIEFEINVNNQTPFCKLNLVNTTEFPLHIFSSNRDEKIYNTFFNPGGNQPLILPRKIKFEMVKTTKSWYVSF